MALHLLVEIHREFGRPLHVAYIEVSFDSVDHKALWKALKTQGTPSFLLCLIKDLYEGTTSCVRAASGDVFDSFSTSSDVRQGCIPAPVLFYCAIDWILRRTVHALGVTIGSNTFTDFDYVDDAVLSAHCSANWSSSLQLFDDTAGSMGMHTSYAKTKIQNVSPGIPLATVTINGHNIDTTEKFTYLGSDVDSSGYSSPDICHSIGLEASRVGRLNRVWSNRPLHLSSKLRVYNTCCPTCSGVWLGDLDATRGGQEETSGLPHEMQTPTARGMLERFRHQCHCLREDRSL